MTTELLGLDPLPVELLPHAYTVVAVRTARGTKRYRAMLGSTGQGFMASWTTAERPVPAEGQAAIGFNSDTLQIEAGVGTANGVTWAPLGGAAGGSPAPLVDSAGNALVDGNGNALSTG